MNILYLTYDGLTDTLGQSQIIPYLAGLSSKGYQIVIVSFEKKNKFEKLSSEIKSLLFENKIKWIPLKYHYFPPVLSSVYDVFKLKSVSKKIVQKEKIDIVHCRSYITALVGLHLKKKKKVKFIFDMRGFWADERIDGNLWNLKNPVYKKIYTYFKQKEKEFFEQADCVVSLTDKGKNIIQKQFDNKIYFEVIPCCVDTVLFSKKNIQLDREKYFRNLLKIDEQDFIISYLGSLGTWYLPDEMMKFFRLFLNKNENAKFMFITPDSQEMVFSYSDKYNITKEKIIVIASERKNVPVLLSFSRLSLFFIKPLFSKSASSPTKMAEALSIGIPIICNAGIGDNDKIITESGAGLVIKDFSDESLQEAVDKLDSLLSLSESDIRKTAIDIFSLEKGVGKYHKIYTRLREIKS